MNTLLGARFPRAARISVRAGSAVRPLAARALLRALLPIAFAVIFLSSCQSPDPVAKEKTRTLTPDERYLVEYYMKIIEYEKYLHDNPGVAEDRKAELLRSFDEQRIRKTLAELEKKPEHWLAIYNRINELQLRSLQK